MKYKSEKFILIFYLLFFMAAACTVALLQPMADTLPLLANPPDEHARYLVPRFICEYGKIPTGFEEEIRIPSYGFSYGIYNVFPYIIQGYFMRVVSLFTDSELMLVYAARFINVLSGTAMAGVVYLLSRKLFGDRRFRWLFCFAVMFLPESLFMHTYVNTDSMCLLSTAMMVYALVSAWKEGFTRRNCLWLAGGIILCALSYYNAYGYILSSILLFVVYFLRVRMTNKQDSALKQEGITRRDKSDRGGKKADMSEREVLKTDKPVLDKHETILSEREVYEADKLEKDRYEAASEDIVYEGRRWNYDWKEMLRKGIFISVLVLAGIGWWFIRSYILYDGDILGLDTREKMAAEYAIEEVNPLAGNTYKEQGIGVLEMMRQEKFMEGAFYSFVAAFGSVSITGDIWMYRLYKIFFAVGGLGLLVMCLVWIKERRFRNANYKTGFFHVNMIFCMAMPLILLIQYAYTMDFQNQGRYLLPAIVPLMYYITAGWQKLLTLKWLPRWVSNAGAGCLYAFLAGELAWMVYGIAVPVYLTTGMQLP